ncbi:MAG: LD-carboxypeptidase [Treponema succinifaciens]|nr:MAG: LD-carboxypeptidase [Treponema succinifaciens]
MKNFIVQMKIPAVISAGGGEMMCETAGFIDFEKNFRCKTQKWFMGYSDNTNFIFPLVTKCKVAAIYGPTITGFGKKWQTPELYSLGLFGRKCKKKFQDLKKIFSFRRMTAIQQKILKNLTYNLTEKKSLKIFFQKKI